MNIKSVGKYGKRECFAFFLPILYLSFSCLPSPFQDFVWIGRLQERGVPCRFHRLPMGGRTFGAYSQTIIIPSSYNNISRRSNKRWRWEWRQEAASGSVPTIHHELLLSREVAPSLPVWWILKMNCFGHFFAKYYWKNSNKFSYHLKKSYICRPERVGDIN